MICGKCYNCDRQCQTCNSNVNLMEISEDCLNKLNKILGQLDVFCPNFNLEGCRPHLSAHKRCEIDDHLKECRYTFVECQYQKYGCERRFRRYGINEHEKKCDYRITKPLHEEIYELKEQIKLILQYVERDPSLMNRVPEFNMMNTPMYPPTQ